MEDTEVTVAAVEGVGEDAIAIDFESPDGFEARPGQFVKVALPIDEGTNGDGEDGDETTESRFYTISSPDVRDTFEITVEIDPDGKAANKGLQPGDVILEVAGTAVQQPEDVANGIEAAKKRGRKAVSMLVRSGDRQLFVAIPLEKT
jgi:ferredoxin-NADP reductase